MGTLSREKQIDHLLGASMANIKALTEGAKGPQAEAIHEQAAHGAEEFGKYKLGNEPSEVPTESALMVLLTLEQMDPAEIQAISAQLMEERARIETLLAEAG